MLHLVHQIGGMLIIHAYHRCNGIMKGKGDLLLDDEGHIVAYCQYHDNALIEKDKPTGG